MGLYSALAACIFITLISILYKNTSDSILWGCMTCLTILTLIEYHSEPKAIDVYRNKTELKINGTYKDSIFIPTDSIVIFKK